MHEARVLRARLSGAGPYGSPGRFGQHGSTSWRGGDHPRGKPSGPRRGLMGKSAQRQCKVNAKSVQSQRNVSAQSVQSQCKPSTKSVKVSAKSVQSQCKASAKSVQTQCKLSAKSVQSQCEVSPQISAYIIA
eukprot:988810-Pyramimonas_sp.AAC.1